MIDIRQKEKCCGCTACQQACSRNAIEMVEDEQGFAYPKVVPALCVDCHLCEDVCPVLHPFEPKEGPLRSLLARNRDEEIRSASSSGGIFSVLALQTISRGGAVFGVRFTDDWLTTYDVVEDEAGLASLRGSKYVQTPPAEMYRRVRTMLREGREVLFVGTPCIVAGLNHFLRKSYDNLLTVDIVCHSIPSQKMWKTYMDELREQYQAEISHVTFRNKENGWTSYSLGVTLSSADGRRHRLVEAHDDNAFMKGFLHDIFTRPGCSDCPARNYRSGSDLTIADAWGIDKYHPEWNDEKGLSHILVNTPKGDSAVAGFGEDVKLMTIDYAEVEPRALHQPLTASTAPHPYRRQFYAGLRKGEKMIPLVHSLVKKHEDRMELKRRIYRIVSPLMGLLKK